MLGAQQSTSVAAPSVRRSARAAVHSARRALLDRQQPDGHWVGELQGDTILESEYLLLLAFLGKLDDPAIPKLANYLRKHQQTGGGWSNYPDGPADVSVSVKAYFALKLAGDSADAPHMQRACEVIRNLGGAEACNSFSKFYLALLGELPYASCAAVPPELVLLPRWFYVNLYAMSSWTRTIVVPLSLAYAHKPVTKVPTGRGIRELYLGDPRKHRSPCKPTRRWISWTNFFLATDRLYKKLEWMLGPIRRAAVRQGAAWMRQHFADSDGVGAIFPPMIYTVIALRCLGVADDDPEMQWAMKQLHDLKIEEGDTLRLQPCVSPVWDTALATIALADTDVPSHSTSVRKAVDWLLAREIRNPGDWSLMNPGVEPGGWVFEYRNSFYPDTDDTAMVLMALARSQPPKSANPDLPNLLTDDGEPSDQAAIDRGVKWLFALQNSDGGWAAFDRDINRKVLEKVPFADHNAMLDPSCPDITARVLEALSHHGVGLGRNSVERAIAFLRRTQEPDCGWPGRWGVNYIYGTWQVLQGLAAIGFDPSDGMVRRAVEWLKKVQQPSGAWGESCASYEDPSLAGVGAPTASQTAWALLGLIAAGEGRSPAVKAGVEWLIANQQDDGTWQEDQFTGTGFPKVFYLKYHYYALYFPLMALSRFQNRTRKTELATDGHR